MDPAIFQYKMFTLKKGLNVALDELEVKKNKVLLPFSSAGSPWNPRQIISRPGQSQGLLYKHLFHSLINSVNKWAVPSNSFMALHAQTVRDSTSSYKIDYVKMINNFLNPEGHQNPFSGSKVTVTLLNGWIWPIGGVALGRVCVCSLRSRLVFGILKIFLPTDLCWKQFEHC